jgi:hypothetical protein
MDVLKQKIGYTKTIAFEQGLDASKLLTPKVIMEYEEAREKELSKKHDDRIKELKDTNEDEILQKYIDLGGGSRFFSVNSGLVKESVAENKKQKWGYVEVVKYEQERQAFYQQMIDKINEPLDEIKKVRNKINGEQEKLKAYNNMLNESNVTTSFENKTNFKEFTNKTVGDDARNFGNEIIANNTTVESTAKDAEQNTLSAIKEFEDNIQNDQELDALIALDNV